MKHCNNAQIAGETSARGGIDDYPSRRESVPQVIPRKDPVVYSNWRQDAPLSEEQTAFYDANGFLSFDIGFSKESRGQLIDEATRLAHEKDELDSNVVITEPDREEIRSIFRVHDLSPIFEKLLKGTRLVEIARFLLGDDVYIHQSRLNYKPGFHGKEFYWHSDFETWHVEDGMPRMRALSMSISLYTNNELNGPLMVIPKSHFEFIPCVGEAPEDHYKSSLKKQEYGVPDEASLTSLAARGGIVAPKGPAGSVTIFDCNIMHGSNSNITPYPRSNVFVVYNALSNHLVAPFGSRPPRPDFLAARGERVVAI